MKDIRRWFTWLVIIGPIHMVEQMIFGLDELEELKRLFTSFYGWFGNADYATVTLVTVSFTVVNLIALGMIVGGRWRFASIGFFALLGVGEIHHVLRVAASGTYNPGVVTSVLFFLFGVLLSRALVSEYRRTYAPASAAHFRSSVELKAS